MSFVGLEDLQKASQKIIEVEVEGLGKVKVAKLTNKELREQANYIGSLADDPARALKVRYSMVGVALRKEDGSRMFSTLEEAEKVLDAIDYDTFMSLYYACILDINELSDEKILERAKKSRADQSTDATAG